MSTKRSAPEKAPEDRPKRKRKMLTIAEKVKLLDMLKEGRSYAAVGLHYGINESSVRYIKKEENNIRATAAISFNKNAKRVVTVRNKTIVRMESLLALWINDCRKNNITLNNNVIRGKAKKLYKTLADREEEEDLGPSTRAVRAASVPFIASKGWFEKFRKRFVLRNGILHGEAASANTAGAEADVNNTFNRAQQLGGDDVKDEPPDDIDAYTRPLTDEDLAEMMKLPSEDEEEEDTGVDRDEEDGLTFGRLATMVKMASELQRMAQEWDPMMFRSLQFSNVIEAGMSVYKNLLAQKETGPTITHCSVLSEKGTCTNAPAQWSQDVEIKSEEL